MSAVGVRRGKAAFFSGCKSHPAIAPAGSNRSGHGGDEMAEALGIACYELVSLDFRCGSKPEVSDGRENVGFRGYSGSRFWASEGPLIANSRLTPLLEGGRYRAHRDAGGGSRPPHLNRTFALTNRCA